jgi:hypothetical protein
MMRIEGRDSTIAHERRFKDELETSYRRIITAFVVIEGSDTVFKRNAYNTIPL